MRKLGTPIAIYLGGVASRSHHVWPEATPTKALTLSTRHLVSTCFLVASCAVAVESTPPEPNGQGGADSCGESCPYPTQKPAEPNPCAPMLMWVQGVAIEVPVACTPYLGDRGDPEWSVPDETTLPVGE